jgi:hypothetical protein
MTDWKTHVQPHGEIIQIGAGLWQVTGTLKRSPLPRNMVVWRTPQRGLLIHSAICLNEDGMRRLDALGEVTHIVVPCEMHCADIAPYQKRYPQAKILCPACARIKVEELVPVTDTVEDGLSDLNVTLHRPEGLKDFEMHLELPLEDNSRALVITDALFNLRESPPTGLGGFILKLLGSVGPLNITKIGKRLLLKDKEAFADYVAHLAEIPHLAVVLVAHGKYIRAQPAQALKDASARIRK